MKLQLKRIAKKANYTIGKLSINGKYLCDTIEDTDRGLKQGMSATEIKAKKVYAKTAIPSGTYTISLNIVSPSFSLKPAYKKIGGRLPRLLNVTGFEGILMHIGNTEKDSAGCIIVGQNKVVGKVINSTDTFWSLYAELDKANKRGEMISLEIV